MSTKVKTVAVTCRCNSAPKARWSFGFITLMAWLILPLVSIMAQASENAGAPAKAREPVSLDPANYSGTWITGKWKNESSVTAKNVWIEITQNGKETTGRYCGTPKEKGMGGLIGLELGKDTVARMTGKVSPQGLRGRIDKFNCPFLFSMDASAKKAEMRTSFMFITIIRECHRVVLGDAAGFAHLPRPLKDSGGLLCQLSVAADGHVFKGVTEGDGVREVVVLACHLPGSDGTFYTALVAIPVEQPAQLSLVRDSRGMNFFQREGFSLLPDIAVFLEARRRSMYYNQQRVDLDGRPGWCVVSAAPDDTVAFKELLLAAEIYQQNPNTGALPIERVSLGRVDAAGKMQMEDAFLTPSSKLQRLHPTERDGRVFVEMQSIGEPPLEMLVQWKFSALTGRWLTGALIEAKNRTLPKLLRESKTDKLVDLTSTIEKRILEITHARELAKGRAQAAIQQEQKNEKQIESDRQLALLCTEVIEVLKPILAAIKEEVANRAR